MQMRLALVAEVKGFHEDFPSLGFAFFGRDTVDGR